MESRLSPDIRIQFIFRVQKGNLSCLVKDQKWHVLRTRYFVKEIILEEGKLCVSMDFTRYIKTDLRAILKCTC